MTNDVTRPRQWRGSAKAWLAAVLVAVALAPLPALAAWSTALGLGPVLDVLGWHGLPTRALLLGGLAPIVFAGIGVPLTYALAPRLGLRLIGEHETASLAVRHQLDRAAGRAARRQGIEIDLRVTEARLAEPVVVPTSPRVEPTARPVLAVSDRLTGLDDHHVDVAVTPILYLARRRPVESRARMALQAPTLLVQGFWRTLRWQPSWRVPLLGSVVAVATLAAPSSISLPLRPLAGLALAATILTALALMWLVQPIWARGIRAVADRTMGDPVAGVTLPSWVIDLRDDDRRDRPGGLGPTEATA